MQRVRIGLTGLACVFLLVLLAAALLGLARHEAELSGPPAADGPKAIGNASADDKAKEDINATAPAAPAGAQP
jgi:hypothetical protein